MKWTNLLFIEILIQVITVAYAINERYSNWVSFLNWGKKKGLKLNKINLNFTSNQDLFLVNEDIEMDETIMIIPKDMFISFDKTFNLTTPKMQQKWKDFNQSAEADKVFSKTRLKEQSFIAIIESIAYQKKKGKFYQKYKPYLSLIKETYDNYPIFYSDDEVNFIIHSHFGKLLFKAKSSMNDEYNYITSHMNIHIDQDTYFTFRVLGEAQTKIIKDKAYIIPLFGFLQISFGKYNTIDEFKDEADGLVLKARRPLSKGEVVEIETRLKDNTMLLMYYGTTFELGTKTFFPISIIHKELKWNMNYKAKFNKTVDIANDNYLNSTIAIYKSILKEIGKSDSDLNGYRLMLENLNTYKAFYDEIKESDYYKVIISSVKRTDIKRVIDSEKVVLEKRIKEVNTLIAKMSKDDL